MILVGQYDSPFVRRVAVTMNIYTMPFERRVLSVFTDFEAMLAVNPLGKVPVLQLEDGELLYDSRAILDYLVGLVPVEKRLVPAGEPHRRRILRIEAVALGLAEKLYERGVEFARRDQAKRDPAMVARAETQIASALSWLDALRPAPWLHGDRISRADVTAAIAVTYMREKHSALAARAQHAFVAAHCDRCEGLIEFARAAYSAAEAQRSGCKRCSRRTLTTAYGRLAT
jgi:glutathione S-transferase